MKKDVVVLGIGNPLMADEGIGPAIIEQLAKLTSQYPSVDFIDAGTAGFQLVHMMADRRKAILIDCAIMNAEPGTIKRFTPDEVESVKNLTHFSLHEADVLKIIEMLRELDQTPQSIVIFGIEPKKIEPTRQLSPVLAAKLDEYLAMVRREIEA